MIVGFSRATTRKEAPAMAGADRMTVEEVVKQVMVRERGDVLRAAVEAVCAEPMEARCRRRSVPSSGSGVRTIG
jgi:hypothetical protein